MRLNHFFEGMLKKEEVASAFLATALEHVLAILPTGAGATAVAATRDEFVAMLTVAVRKLRNPVAAAAAESPSAF